VLYYWDGGFGTDAAFHARDAATGEVRWSFPVGDWADVTPTVAEGRVYFGSYDKNLYAVDAATGELVWKRATDWGVSSAPWVEDGRLYVVINRTVCALDAATGKDLWTFPRLLGFGPGPILADGVVYAGVSASVVALRAADGTLQWERPTDSWVIGLVVRDGTVYVSTGEGILWAFAAQDGKEQWRFETGKRMSLSPPVLERNVVYVGSFDGRLYALDRATGAVRWHYRTGGHVSSGPLVRDGVAYFGSWDNYLYAVRTDWRDDDLTDAEVEGALAAAYRRGGQPERALDLLHPLVERYDNDPALRHERAQAWDDIGRREEGLAEWQEVLLRAAPGDGHYEAAIAQLQERIGLRWHVPLQRNGDITPAVDERAVYACDDQYLYAFDRETGEELWRAEGYTDDPIAADGQVWSAASRKVICLDAATGAPLWESETERGTHLWGIAALADEIVYVKGDRFFAFDRADGEVLWDFAGDDDFWNPACLLDNLVCCVSEAGTVYALNPDTGEEQWRFQADASLYSPICAAHGRIYFGSLKTLYALDAATREGRWTFQPPGKIDGWSLQLAGDTLYSVARCDAAYAFDTATGRVRWRVPLEYLGAVLAVVDGVVYADTSDGRLLTLDAATGEQRWSLRIGRFSPVVDCVPQVREGRLYVVGRGLYAFDLDRLERGLGMGE
jgi:outer membrane protein assembly factor BamB